MTMPNIVFILADQLRADFLGCYGADFVLTPNIDALSARGVRYVNAISAYPVCVPARTALMTGMNAIKNGVTDNSHGLRADYSRLGIKTWPEVLTDAGYATAAVGKMHFYPWDARRGFTYRQIAEDKRWLNIRDDYYQRLRKHGYTKQHGEEFEGYHENQGAIVNPLPRHLTPDGFVGDKACDFVTTYGPDEPFALMVGFPGPHDPYDPHRDALSRVNVDKIPVPVPAEPENTERLRQQNIAANRLDWNKVDYETFTESAKHKIRLHYAALVTQIDDEVGRIVGSLEAAGVADNTVIIISSDHGDYLGDHAMIGKGTFLESAIRVPMIVSDLGAHHGVVSEDLVSLHDVASTILALTGCDVPGYMDSQPLPGPGIRELPPVDHGRTVIFGMLHNAWMAFDGQWKLHKYETGDTLLYDIHTDPNEQANLAADPRHLQTLLRLDAALTEEIMRSMQGSVDDRLVLRQWTNDRFGREGWHGLYPADI